MGAMAMTTRTRARSGLHLPLRRLALCLDCDETVEIGLEACPICGSETRAPPARFLEIAPAGPLHRLVGGLSGGRAASKWRIEGRHAAPSLLLVARVRPGLYAQLERALAGDPAVQVLLDRRVRERRQSRGSRLVERRRGAGGRATPSRRSCAPWAGPS
jgi:hypothetical protein